MSHFPKLCAVKKVQVHPKPVWELTAELWYYSTLVGAWVRVPKGFRTDFASVPRLPVVYWWLGGMADEAAIVHDWLYSSQIYSREVADAILKEAVIAMGYGDKAACAMWLAVRAAGGIAWNTPNVPQHEAVLIELEAA